MTNTFQFSAVTFPSKWTLPRCNTFQTQAHPDEPSGPTPSYTFVQLPSCFEGESMALRSREEHASIFASKFSSEISSVKVGVSSCLCRALCHRSQVSTEQQLFRVSSAPWLKTSYSFLGNETVNPLTHGRHRCANENKSNHELQDSSRTKFPLRIFAGTWTYFLKRSFCFKQWL